MRLMERDAWEVKEAPSVIGGVDLLKNLPTIPNLGALDGRVAAHIEMGKTAYFVTTNTCYVPLLPEINPKQIVMRRDMRFGPDDPVLWPRLYSDRFCHLAAIPKAPTRPEDRNELGVMWWNPSPANFICPASGLTVSRGLGRLEIAWFSEFAVRTAALINKYGEYVNSLPTGTKPPLLLPQLVQRLQLSLERLRIPSTYVRMVIFWKACLPCWFIRPIQAFADESILKVVVPFAASDFLEMGPAPGFSPVPATERLDERLSLLHRCTENMPWYRNPFEDDGPAATNSAAGSSRGGSAAGPCSAPRRNMSPAVSSGKGSPYAAARAQSKAQKEAKGPNENAKPARDKFLPLDRPEMPTTITPWATALGEIDRSCPPWCGSDKLQLYVMPEPALLASPEEAPRRHLLYHHYRLLRDALMFRLADREQRHPLLTTQQWRDTLQGKVTKQGKTGTRAQQRSANLEDLLRPAFNACGIDALTEFPVRAEAIPPLNVNSTKELLWELAEINFRYEFLALDARASRLNRPDECRRCFAGPGLIGMDIRESQRGLAALEAMERLPYLLCMAGLMRDWSVPCKRPKEIDNARGHTEWSSSSIRHLEKKVATYYTQSFYELFGRAAVVPMRLQHTIAQCD
ncbi:hypothetical protein C8F04DRAFT_1276569 [Mycena alexandri]|uniref:Uncharacterized protein n=1 Tax=Mycena alexandri TaxID=1745969 RepID=A0AAD6S0Y0_9AGAR|nr:hypothetical protein C8F04DRAFT_1276569 [Mycena alexandri]